MRSVALDLGTKKIAYCEVKEGQVVTRRTVQRLSARLSLSPGSHEVSVAIGETYNPSEWKYTDRRTIRLEPRARVVVLFDRAAGFTWDGI